MATQTTTRTRKAPKAATPALDENGNEIVPTLGSSYPRNAAEKVSDPGERAKVAARKTAEIRALNKAREEAKLAPKAKAAAAKAATPKAPKAPAICHCGCNEETKGGLFRMGHDARLKGILIKGTADPRYAKVPASVFTASFLATFNGGKHLEHAR